MEEYYRGDVLQSSRSSRSSSPRGRVCPTCLPDVSARRVCPTCLPDVSARRVCPTCLPDVSARRVCPTCLPDVSANFTLLTSPC